MPDITFNPTTTSAQVTPEILRSPVRALDQQDFLKLLVAQMTNQDPLQPVQDAEFIGQMAQFTALEQAKSTYDLTLANSLMGQRVTVESEDPGLESEDEKMIEGIVTGVSLQGGTPRILVDGRPFELRQVVSYGPVESQTT